MADWHEPKTWKPGALEITGPVFNYEIRDLLQYLYDNISGTPPTPDTWHAPTLLNSWVNAGGAEEEAGYWKSADGIVYLRGTISDGASNTQAFSLPVGYRPPKRLIQIVYADNIGSAALTISSSGAVAVVDTGVTWSSGTGQDVSINAVFHTT